jgi:hypothetical protein
MKLLLELIDKKQQEYLQSPFFKYMEDNTIEPRQKLVYAPIVVPLALDFSEWCKQVIRDEPTTNRIQEMLNVHTYEEHFHWQWLLEDMEKMGIDYPVKFSDAAKFLWSEQTKVSRAMLPLFSRYTYGADPIIKLIALEVSEVTANAFFKATMSAALQLEEMQGEEFRYFGTRHNQIENTHTLHTPACLQEMKDIEISDEIREKAIEVINVSFDYFTKLVDEFYLYAQAHSYQEPFAKVYQSEQVLSLV